MLNGGWCLFSGIFGNKKDKMSRLADYKNHGRDIENMRSKRKEVTIELRKSKREGQLSKKRNLDVEEDGEDQAMDAAAGDSNAIRPDSTSIDIESFPGFLASLKEEFSDPLKTVIALRGIRKLLSQEGKHPISFMVEAGVIPLLIKFLHSRAGPGMQYEATWSLTNIASGASEHTMAVVNAGAVPKLVALLSSHNEEVKHQAVWALGNIAGDGYETRDLNPPPNFEQALLCLPVLNMALQCPDLEVKVIDQDIVPNLVPMLNSEHVKQLIPAIRAVGNIVSGNDAQTDTVIEAGGLPLLIHILSNHNHHIVKEATWALSNVTAGNITQIQAAISAGLLHSLKNVLEKVGDKYGCLTKYALAVEECQGLDKIESLQQHANAQLFAKASDIIEHFFQTDGDADEAAASLETFQFSAYEESSETPQFNFD
ncbi:hypothetical protein B566_EDAN001041 [Ephemera danica]|nr:hypothetical protein B566_EDAN001041 [Ephemera danica]